MVTVPIREMTSALQLHRNIWEGLVVMKKTSPRASRISQLLGIVPVSMRFDEAVSVRRCREYREGDNVQLAMTSLCCRALSSGCSESQLHHG